jgi:hypothetical protein
MIYDIPLIEVKSSVLLAVGYEQISETLRVVFNSGSEYRYTGVPIQVYRNLCNAESIGQEFNRTIRNRYECTVVQVLKVTRKV